MGTSNVAKYLLIKLDLKLELVTFVKEIEYSNLKKWNLRDFKFK